MRFVFPCLLSIALLACLGCTSSVAPTASVPAATGDATAETEATASTAEGDEAAVVEAPVPDADGWYSLFNGKDLTGWKTSEVNPDTFKVVDGAIVVHGPKCHLYYVGPLNDANFKNFQWKCELLTKPGSNSGMYFHTKYQPEGWPDTGIEVQVNNTHGDPIKTGSLYRIANVMDNSPAKDDEWFTQHVIVDGRHVVVKVNDKVVNDYVESDPPERDSDWTEHIIASGTFALQGHDPKSEIHFRNVLVKPLP